MSQCDNVTSEKMSRMNTDSSAIKRTVKRILGTTLGLPSWLSGKECGYNAGDMDLIPGSGRSPGEGNGQLTPVFLPGKSHGQRSQVGYSP